jgi:hypothetical protein
MSKKFLLASSMALALSFSVSSAQAQDLGLPAGVEASPVILPGVAIAGFIAIAAGVIGGSNNNNGGAGGATPSTN